MGTLNRGLIAVAAGMAMMGLAAGAAVVDRSTIAAAAQHEQPVAESKRRNGVKDRNSRPSQVYWRTRVPNQPPARNRRKTAKRHAARRAKLRNRRAA